MRELNFQFSCQLSFSEPVTDHAFLLRCLPRQAREQEILSLNLQVVPEGVQLFPGRDSFGNQTMSGWVPEEHRDLSYQVSGAIRRDDMQEEAPEYLPCFAYPSAMTKPSPEMTGYLQELELTGSPSQKAQALAEALHERLEYVPGSTSIYTTAAEAFRQGIGVCQDFAHIFLSLARLAGIPARYVCGLPMGEGATHAWAEIWQDGHWLGYDPTRNRLADETYITLAVGRDYGDCPIERGVFHGTALQTQQAFMQVWEKE